MESVLGRLASVVRACNGCAVLEEVDQVVCFSAVCIFTSTASIRGVASAAHINKGLDDRLSRISFP